MPQVLQELLSEGRLVEAHRPWPRAIVGASRWAQTARDLAEGRLTLLSLWGEPDAVHMAVMAEARAKIAVLSLPCPEASFPSVGAEHAPAIRMERALADLFGLKARHAHDARPWLDHGRWGVRHPMGSAELSPGETAYGFLEAEGESLHRIGVGPVHAGIIEPGHFRFTASGETVVRLEERLGYVHRGIEALMAGAPLARAAVLAARASGDSTVAYAIAFARAAEAALGLDVPPRAHALRAVMAELERIANHLGDFGAICNDASFALIHAHCTILREQVLRAAGAGFGHRLMRDCIVPGGAAKDLPEDGIAAIRWLMDEVAERLPVLKDVYDDTASLQDRTVGTGILAASLARQFGAGGFVGRASARAFDARRFPGYVPYDRLDFEIPVLEAGDVNARVWIRIREVEQSLAILDRLLSRLPEGPIAAPAAPAGRAAEGMALVEGFRGDILVWLRLDADGSVARCHLRDPSWFQWPLLEAAVEGNIVADFPLCNKSFNCSYAGHDL